MTQSELEEFVTALQERRFMALGKMQSRTGISREEVREYLDKSVSSGTMSSEDRDKAVRNLDAWKRWGRRNAMVVIPCSVLIATLALTHNHVSSTVIMGPAVIGLGVALMQRTRFQKLKKLRSERPRD
jgi:hypothetical protein